MLLLLVGLSQAGVVVGVVGGAEVALDSRPADTWSPAASALVGYRFDDGALRIQPELLVHMNFASPMINAPIGVSVATKGTVGFGGYAHVSAPILSYPWPGLDAGGLVELSLGDHLDLWVRSGWEWSHAPHYKCGDCPQPSDHWWVNSGGVSVAF